MMNDSQMSGVVGQTRYKSLSVVNFDLVFALNRQPAGPFEYCAGCNGAFLLDFTVTSAGSRGVFGAGFDYFFDLGAQLPPGSELDVIATFHDGTTQTFPLVPGLASQDGIPTHFLGLTSPVGIESFAVGMVNGQPMGQSCEFTNN